MTLPRPSHLADFRGVVVSPDEVGLVYRRNLGDPLPRKVEFVKAPPEHQGVALDLLRQKVREMEAGA